jgi:hypothetical protein
MLLHGNLALFDPRRSYQASASGYFLGLSKMASSVRDIVSRFERNETTSRDREWRFCAAAKKGKLVGKRGEANVQAISPSRRSQS